MSKKKQVVKKEKLSKRMRKAYRRGYVQGFEDSRKSAHGRGYVGAYGYRCGWNACRKIRKINAKVEKYKNEEQGW